MSNKKKPRKESAYKQINEVEEVEDTGIEAGSTVSKLQHFYETNEKLVLGVLGAFTILLAGLLFWKFKIQPDRAYAAEELMFTPQNYFEQDSFKLALESYDGFLDIANNYGGTKYGNLSKYYAGLCYFHLGNYDEAITWLTKYKAKEDITGAQALSVVGDCYMNTGNTTKGLSFYKKSAESTKNSAIAPALIWKAGMAFEHNGDYKTAYEYYKKVKKDYPTSTQAQDIDKFIARTEAMI